MKCLPSSLMNSILWWVVLWEIAVKKEVPLYYLVITPCRNHKEIQKQQCRWIMAIFNLIRINKESFSPWCCLCCVPRGLIPSKHTFSQWYVDKGMSSKKGHCGSRIRRHNWPFHSWLLISLDFCQQNSAFYRRHQLSCHVGDKSMAFCLSLPWFKSWLWRLPAKRSYQII